MDEAEDHGATLLPLPPTNIEMPVAVAARSHSRQGKHTPVPLILESFPSPPTFIPPSPSVNGSPPGSKPSSATIPRSASALLSPPLSSTFNPPPSLPPAVPLPPVPGPSPISDHETILILSGSRSRRSSKISLQPTSRPSSQYGPPRTSTDISPNSSGGIGLMSPSPSATHFTLPTGRRSSIASSRSLRSYPSNSSLSSQSLGLPRPPFAEKPSTIGYAISEEDSADLSHTDVKDPWTSSVANESDKENVADKCTRQERSAGVIGPGPGADDSISSIDMRELPLDDERDAAGADADTLVQNFHLHMRANRSKSDSDKKLLRSRSSSPGMASVASSSTNTTMVPPLPAGQKGHKKKRSTSPDIASMISTTPRPRTRSSAHASIVSVGSGSRPGSMKRHASENLLKGRSRTLSRGSTEGVQSPVELAYMKDELWNDDSFVSDYGKAVDGHDNFWETDPHLEAEIEGASDSDSSIDLHTPLPHLMLRHGLLSPHSKLLPESTGVSAALSRPGSTMSLTSNVSMMTKSGLFKDQRDTPQRRVRHRDGRQLKAGMGLTTGLGWSDSEDEDAPSPLTRRLSNLNIANRPSTSSLKPGLSRSQSSTTLREEDEPADPVAARRRPRPSLPPTAWQKKAAAGSGGGRTSTSSAGSGFSLTLSIPEDDSSLNGIKHTPSGSSTTQSGLLARSGRDNVDTPSTASTSSLPMPVTPDDAPGQYKLDTEKGLPPLPSGGLRKYPSAMSLRAPSAVADPTRHRTYSSASSVSSAAAVNGHNISSVSTPEIPTLPSALATPSAPYIPRTVSTPRPLRLSQTLLAANIQPGEFGEPPGLVLAYNRNLHDQQRSRVPSGSGRPTPSRSSTIPFTSETPNFSKPMPRTGTGMVYRTSSTPGRPPAATRMRPPGPSQQSLSLNARPIAL